MAHWQFPVALASEVDWCRVLYRSERRRKRVCRDATRSGFTRHFYFDNASPLDVDYPAVTVTTLRSSEYFMPFRVISTSRKNNPLSHVGLATVQLDQVLESSWTKVLLEVRR